MRRIALAAWFAAGLTALPLAAMARGGKGSPPPKPPHVSPPHPHVESMPKPHVPPSLPPEHHGGGNSMGNVHEMHQNGSINPMNSAMMGASTHQTPTVYKHTGSAQPRAGGGSYHHYYMMPSRNYYSRPNTTASAQGRHLHAIINDLDVVLASNPGAASTLASGGAHTRHVMLHSHLMAAVHNTYRPDSGEVEQLTRSIARAMLARPRAPINTASMARDLMEIMNARNLSLQEVQMRTQSAHAVLVNAGVQQPAANNVLLHLRNIGLGSHGALQPGQVF